MVYIISDLFSAYALAEIADTCVATSSRLFTSSRRQLTYSSTAIAAGFLFNPLTIATCLARPTSVLTNSLILFSIYYAAHGKSVSFVLTLGIAAYTSLYPVLFFPPLACLSYDQQISRLGRKLSPLGFTFVHVLGFLFVISSLIVSSSLVTGSTQFLKSLYGTPLLLPDLTPNVGLWWYFFIEMFDSFRNFFLGIFWLHMASYVAGLTIRIRKQPLFVVICLSGLFAVFQPYPSIADSALFLAMVPLYQHVFPGKLSDRSKPWHACPADTKPRPIAMRYPFLEIAVLLYAALLGPAFYHLWIYAGSGNANFFYAITLVWSLGLILINADLLFAVLRDEWEVERPEMRGKEIRQI